MGSFNFGTDELETTDMIPSPPYMGLKFADGHVEYLEGDTSVPSAPYIGAMIPDGSKKYITGSRGGPTPMPTPPIPTTMIIDTDQKLADWSNNVTSSGQDYTSVQVVGNLSLSKALTAGTSNAPTPMIDLTITGTKWVQGDGNTTLLLTNTANVVYTCGIKGYVTGTYPNLVSPGSDYGMAGICIQYKSIGSYTTGIYKCSNMAYVSCISSGTNASSSSTYSYGYGFYNCTNLSNCTGTASRSNLVGSIDVAYTYGYGFYNCTNLSNCIGAGNSLNSLSGNGNGNGYGYGFYNCANLSNCIGTGTGSNIATNNRAIYSYGYGYGFYNCTNLSNCIGTGVGLTASNCYSGSVTANAYSYSYGFYSCSDLNTCTGTGICTTTAFSNGSNFSRSYSYGFYSCTNLSSCTGTGNSSTCTWTGSNTGTMHGFSSACTSPTGAKVAYTADGGMNIGYVQP
jgi:hypothetical protein